MTLREANEFHLGYSTFEQSLLSTSYNLYEKHPEWSRMMHPSEKSVQMFILLMELILVASSIFSAGYSFGRGDIGRALSSVAVSGLYVLVALDQYLGYRG